MGILQSLMYTSNEKVAVLRDRTNHMNRNESTKRKKSKLQPTSEDSSLMMSIFTDDLLLEIFLRLPHAHSFIRCAAVCKRWRYLLSSDGFAQRCKLHHRNEDHSTRYTLVLAYILRPCQLLFSEQSKTLHSKASSNPSSYLDFVPPDCLVIASAGELLLLRPYRPCTGTRYVVCNPLTRQSVSLPSSPSAISLGMSHGLVFRKNTSFFYVFKFNCHLCLGPDSVFPIEVFSSETGKWVQRTIVTPSDMPPCYFNLVESALTAENGVMYVPFISVAVHTGAFLAFDPFSADEPKKGYFVDSPPGYNARGWRRANQGTLFCGLHKGRLRVTQCLANKKRESALKIWELSYDRSDANCIDVGSWALVYDGALKRLANAKTMCVKGFHPNNGSVVFVVNNLEEIYEYDFERAKYEKVGRIQSELYPGFNRRYYGCYLTSHALLHPAWPTSVSKFDA